MAYILRNIKKSILNQLALTIAGACVFVSVITAIGYYFFTANLIKDSADQQVKQALDLATDYLERNYTEKLTYDLRLLESSREINTFLTSGVDEYLIHQLNVEKLLLSFAKNRSDLYQSIRLIDVSGSEMAIIENLKRNRNYTTVTMSGYSPSNDSMGELFLRLKTAEPGSILFGEPAFEKENTYFFVGLSKEDPDIGGFGGAIVITFTVDAFKSYLSNFKIFDYSLVWVYSAAGEAIYEVNYENAVSPHPYVFSGEPKPENLMILTQNNSDPASISNVVKTYVVLSSEVRWELLENLIYATAFLLLTITVASLFLAYATAKRIVRPIRLLTKLSHKVAAGNLSVKMPTKGEDEISSLSDSFNIMTGELEKQRQELKALANRDALTALPNRRQFEDHLIGSINRCQRNNESIAVLYIDLDQFKDANDSFGHPAGDKLIQDVAQRLSDAVRKSDLVARLGGDEFAIILFQHKDKANTERVANKILQVLSEPFKIEGHQIFSGASIGISIYPDDGQNSTEIVKNADAAMYKAKQMGRNNYQFYEPHLTSESNERLLLGAEIRQAIEDDELSVYFQPRIDLETEEIIGAEALLRWPSSKSDYIPTPKIIEIAEISGFVEKLDSWVFNQVFKQFCLWKSLSIDLIPISINISGKLLEQNQIIALIERLLRDYSVSSDYIEIEITENHLIKHIEQTEKTLSFLRDTGIKLAIDDFGTGYSSLSYLRDIAANTLKIDRKFIVNTMNNESDKAIATAIIKLASSLKMHVVVEGIETSEQADMFKSLCANSAQGYYYYRPMPVEEFTRLIAQKPSKKRA